METLMYRIDGTVTIREGNWTRTKQIPTFYLNSEIQGITNENHAKYIAETMLRDLISDRILSMNITAVVGLV